MLNKLWGFSGMKKNRKLQAIQSDDGKENINAKIYYLQSQTKLLPLCKQTCSIAAINKNKNKYALK